MRKVILATSGALLMSSSVATADVVGFGASVSYWDSDLSGEAANKNDVVDLENDLNLDSDSNANFTAYLEHPVPVLPNIRLNYTQIDQNGRGQLSTNYDSIDASQEVSSEFELTQFDVTLYYEILDNWANIDVGLTGRKLDGELIVRDTSGTFPVSKTEISGGIPMGYLAGRFDLPFTGVSVGGDVNIISYSGDSISDINGYVQYEVALLQVKAGYRQFSIDYEDSDDRLDLDIDGPFASVGLSF